MGQNIVDIDDNLRIIGTAHVSSASVELVREQIDNGNQTWLLLNSVIQG